MHLPDGVLSGGLACSCWALTGGGLALGLRRMDCASVPKVGVLGAVCFVSNLIAIPLPPASAHPLLNGLMGMLLGWTAFPAIFLALLLQAVQFYHGGLTSLGANTLIMALPAVAAGRAFRPWLERSSASRAAMIGFLAAACAVALSCLLQAAALFASDRDLLAPALVLLAAHAPVMIIDGLITAWAVAFLARVRPETFIDLPGRSSAEARP